MGDVSTAPGTPEELEDAGPGERGAKSCRKDPIRGPFCWGIPFLRTFEAGAFAEVRSWPHLHSYLVTS